MSCKHDLAEMDTACADGMCPLCLAAENKLLQGLVSQAIGWTWAHARANSLQGIELKKNEIPELLQRIQQDIPEMKVAFSDY